MVLTGETGSGKTTQIPQYLAAEAGWKGRIAVTQVLCSAYCLLKSLCCICR